MIYSSLVLYIVVFSKANNVADLVSWSGSFDRWLHSDVTTACSEIVCLPPDC